MKGRKPTNGRFTCRQDLEEKVVFLNRHTDLSVARIAGNVGVSPPVVEKILKNGSTHD